MQSYLVETGGLVAGWTRRTLRGRYQQSLLGWMWAIVQPAASIAVLSLVFTRFVRVDTGDVPYVLFACAGILPWTFLATSLPDMSESIVGNMSLITKTYLRREALPIAAMMARLADFCVSLSLLVALMVWFDRPVFTASWVFLPVIVVVQMAVLMGVGLVCATLNVFFRDVRSLLTLALQVWFYCTPIIYPISMVPERLLPVYLLNPMAGIVRGYQDVLLHNSVPDGYLLGSAAIAVVLLVLGVGVFRRFEPLFADVI